MDVHLYLHQSVKELLMAHGVIILPVYSTPLISLIAGILILIQPKLLNYIVAVYLILIGVIGLTHHYY